MIEASTIPVAAPGSAPRNHNLPDDVKQIVARNPEIALTDEETLSGLIAVLQSEIQDYVPDVSTEAGRKDVRRVARGINAYKSAIDEAGKDMTEEFRRQTGAVNEKRRIAREKLEQLRVEVMQPLTDYELAETKRADEVKAVMGRIAFSTHGIHALPSSALKLRITEIEAVTFDPLVFTQGVMAANEVRDEALRALREAHTSAHQREEQERELAEFRAQKVAQEEAARKSERDAADIQRREDEARATAQKAVAEAEDRTRKEAQAEIDAANAEAEAVRKKVRDAEAARQRAADEAEERERDQQHRAKIHAEAKQAIIDATGMTERKADSLVLVIAAGSVPHISIRY